VRPSGRGQARPTVPPAGTGGVLSGEDVRGPDASQRYAVQVPNTPRYRVVQWTTGNVGKSSVQAVAANPLLDLVGCFAWSPEKVGRDVGELCGIGPLGVAATDDIDALLELKPDCVVYNPMWLDVGELARILSAGVNVVATAAFITGHNLGAGRDRIAEACRRGGSTMLGTGISPGFAELLAIVSATVCDRVDKITVNEAADTTFYDSPATELPVGFGRPIDHPDLQAMTAEGTAVFGEAVRLVGDALGVEFDDVRCEAEYAQTTTDLDLGSWTIAAGCVAGVAASWKGSVGDRVVVELNVRWRKGETLDPDWKIDQDGWVIQVDGRPTVTANISFLPPPDFEAETMADFMVLGHIMTAMPPINAIPAVVAAAPGIATYNDLPLVLPRGVVRAG
jgi:2,4-diaminopentanoate dehydrogenase